jgi:hypothetical protein
VSVKSAEVVGDEARHSYRILYFRAVLKLLISSFLCIHNFMCIFELLMCL